MWVNSWNNWSMFIVSKYLDNLPYQYRKLTLVLIKVFEINAT